jgi:hypothetical protein
MTKQTVDDSQFWDILNESAGIYFKAANIIKERHGIDYTRLMVQKRAELQPDRVKKIQEQFLDHLEDILFLSVNSQNPIAQIRYQDWNFIEQVEKRVLARTEYFGMSKQEIVVKLESNISISQK